MVNQSPVYFLINASAGKQTLSKIPIIEQYAREFALSWHICIISKHDIQDILSEATKDNESHSIVAVGGDGTLNHILNAHMHLKYNNALGLIPSGTGNDFARSAGIPMDIRSALEVIHKQHTCTLDIGQANQFYFANAAGIGFDADVVINTQNFKVMGFGGLPAYLLGVLKTFRTLKTVNAKLDIDGESMERGILLAAASNGQMIGGGMRVAPLAKMNDGLLDFCLIRAVTRRTFLRLLPRFIQGKHINFPEIVEYKKARSCTIHVDRTIAMQVDGEIHYTNQVVFTIHTGALTFITPENHNKSSFLC